MIYSLYDTIFRGKQGGNEYADVFSGQTGPGYLQRTEKGIHPTEAADRKLGNG
jgi:hypothetical protein